MHMSNYCTPALYNWTSFVWNLAILSATCGISVNVGNCVHRFSACHVVHFMLLAFKEKIWAVADLRLMARFAPMVKFLLCPLFQGIRWKWQGWVIPLKASCDLLLVIFSDRCTVFTHLIDTQKSSLGVWPILIFMEEESQNWS